MMREVQSWRRAHGSSSRACNPSPGRCLLILLVMDEERRGEEDDCFGKMCLETSRESITTAAHSRGAQNRKRRTHSIVKGRERAKGLLHSSWCPPKPGQGKDLTVSKD